MKDFLTGFKFAWRGIKHLFKSQRNARVQLAIAVAVTIAGFVFELQAGEWLAIVLCIALVFAAEAFNTALECLADALHPEQHPLVGAAKDLAAGAVLVLAIGSVVVGAIIFLPHLNIRL